MATILCVMVVFYFLLGLILVRNKMVFNERMSLILCLFRRPSIRNRNDWRELMALYDTVSYNKMVYSFWVWPIKKMWPKQLQDKIRILL